MILFINILVSSLQSLSCVQLLVTLWTAAHKASLYITTPRAYTNSHPSVGDAIQQSSPLHPLLLLPLVFPSIRAFSSESVLCIR